MKWWICLAALVLALTTSAGASDLPADLEHIVLGHGMKKG